MKTILIALAMAVASVTVAVAEDQIVATRVQGGPPFRSKDGKRIAPDRVTVAEVKGDEFDLMRKDAQVVVALMGKDSTWWDVGPDSGYVSVVITIGGKTNTVNSWYPLFKDKDTIAIVNGSLVAVESKQEKEQRQSQNSDKYRALMTFLDRIMEKKAPTTGGTVRR
jgi:hypothetical protein